MKLFLSTTLSAGLLLFASDCFAQTDYPMNENETIIIDDKGNIIKKLPQPPAELKYNPEMETNEIPVRKTEYTDDGRIMIPGYVPTGNPAVDEENYKKAKLLLYQNNPEEYKRLLSKYTGHNIVITVSYEEFISLPANKQEYMLSHPEKYFIENMPEKE